MADFSREFVLGQGSGNWGDASRFGSSVAVAVALIGGSAALRAQQPGQPVLTPPGQGRIVGFDVHEGTSMSVSVSHEAA